VLKESRVVTGVYVKGHPGKAVSIEKELSRMTGVSSIQSHHGNWPVLKADGVY
jgi:hypothetical protein